MNQQVFRFNDVVKALVVLGLKVVRKGSHTVLSKTGCNMVVSIPTGHKGKTTHRDLIKRELRKVDLTWAEFVSAMG